MTLYTTTSTNKFIEAPNIEQAALALHGADMVVAVLRTTIDLIEGEGDYTLTTAPHMWLKDALFMVDDGRITGYEYLSSRLPLGQGELIIPPKHPFTVWRLNDAYNSPILYSPLVCIDQGKVRVFP